MEKDGKGWNINEVSVAGNHTSKEFENRLDPSSFLAIQIQRQSTLKCHFTEKVFEVIQQNYHIPGFNIDKLTNIMAMSRRQLYRKSKKYLMTMPSEILKKRRLKESVELLAKGEPLYMISLKCGFSSQSYFCKCFKNYFGFPPSKLSYVNHQTCHAKSE